MVQREVGQLAADLAGRSWAAYPVSYKRMTRERDKARCGGRLQADDELLEQINSRLADVMSRWYVSETRRCLREEPVRDESGGFCPLIAKIGRERYDALSAAMASSAVYISSHLALSLAAVIYDDAVWEVSPDPGVRADGRPWAEIRDRRLAAMPRFKPVYDRFNGFLGDNLQTVAGALQEAGMLRGDTLNFVAGVSQMVPFKAAAFGKIRDTAFAAALRTVRQQAPELHPLVRVQEGGRTLVFSGAARGAVYTPELLQVEREAVYQVANPLSLHLYRSLLGGKSWDDLKHEAEP